MELIHKIETKRLIIRPFKREDLPGFLSFMLDPDSTRYLMFTEEQKTGQGAADLLNMIIDSYQSSQPINSLAIDLKNKGYIGSCGLSELGEDVVECYYSINKECRGNGFAIEAVRSLIDYVFTNGIAKEIRAYMSPENPYSTNVAIESGMNSKGEQRHPVFRNKGLLYSIIN